MRAPQELVIRGNGNTTELRASAAPQPDHPVRYRRRGIEGQCFTWIYYRPCIPRTRSAFLRQRSTRGSTSNNRGGRRNTLARFKVERKFFKVWKQFHGDFVRKVIVWSTDWKLRGVLKSEFLRLGCVNASLRWWRESRESFQYWEDWWESSGEHFSVKRKVPTDTNETKRETYFWKPLVYSSMKFVIYLIGIFLGRTKNTFYTTIIILICNQVR